MTEATKHDIELRKQVDARRGKILRLAKKIYIGMLQKETSIESCWTQGVLIKSSVVAAREFIDNADKYI